MRVAGVIMRFSHQVGVIGAGESAARPFRRSATMAERMAAALGCHAGVAWGFGKRALVVRLAAV